MVANIDMLRACSSATNMSDGAVLQRLEGADRDAELLAGLDVLDRGLQQFVHRADRFRAHRGAGFVDHALDQRQRVLGIADRGISADLDAGEGDVGGMQAVLGRIALAGDALGIGRHEEHADAGSCRGGCPWCAR